MVKARFRFEVVESDGDVIELGDKILALRIHQDPGVSAFTVTWLEEVKE